MTCNATNLFLGVLGFFFIGFINLQAQSVTKKDYQRAEQFLPQNVKKLVFQAEVSPHWAKTQAVFWYQVDTRKGNEYFLVNADNETKEPFFDHKQLATNLSDVFGEQVDPYDLPLRNLDWNQSKNNLQFRAKGKKWKVNLNSLKVSEVQDNSKANSNRLSSTSPNGKWTVTRKNYNLYLTDNQTGRETQLTQDGEKLFLYGASIPWGRKIEIAPHKKRAKPLPLNITWSKNSHLFYANKLDQRDAMKRHLLQYAPPKGKEWRSKVFASYWARPGEDKVIKSTPFVFDVQQKQKIAIHMQPYDQITRGRWIWSGSKLYSIQRSRGYSSVSLIKADTKTGKVDTLFHRMSDTYVDPLNNDFNFLSNTDELLWFSERSGWNQLYLYDLKTGKLKNKVTDGEFVVKSLVDVDIKNRTVYFTATGRESNRDPYLNHFYKVNFDGSNLTLLTPENATHNISLSPDRKYFVDRYSRVDQKPKTVLRSVKDGSVLMTLEEADIKDLVATGWQNPEPFKLKARDDSTNIYGAFFRPSNFDPKKEYPVIDNTYTGPHTFRTPKNFIKGYRSKNQALAELGFIVLTVDGLGTAGRSKKFHNYSYKNFGDMGLPDHIKAIKTLAKKHSFMDTSRVGIYGHSVGGYNAARAMFLRPDFFKVGVASSGNQDLRLTKAWYQELYMGYPMGPEYKEQSNMNIVDNLKGHLLLAHGTMDDNVHPSITFRLAKALIKADKHFDMFIVPSAAHGYGYASSYWTRYRWNYFIEHLLGAKPLHNYEFDSNS